ncbi:synaptonemal complex protein 2-like isoform X1 [Xiphophorus couchianus]|uniref:synaptonemal complex protein 2-like isoform X1 n=1 Tax=Xiphophorus couchianus TaxID=32473 RepID=UPI0010164B43|nr:synaptonemal complex protein 2-like isoform X1 [Xiphophorus couchianus]
MFELQVDDCLLHGDSSLLVSLLHYEGLTSSTLTRLHLLVTKELRSRAFCRVLVVLKSVSILSENKEDLETLVNLGLTAKVMLWFEAVHNLLTSDLQEGSTTLMALTEEFFDYFLLLAQASPPAAQLSVLLLHLAHLALEAGVHFPLRLEAIRTFNSILESLSRQQRRLIQNDQNQNLTQLAAAVVTVGGELDPLNVLDGSQVEMRTTDPWSSESGFLLVSDYEFQVSLLEALCRLTPRREREQRANQWFDSSDIRSTFCDIRDADFEDCRRFLNFVNCCHGDQRRVYSFPCLRAFLSSTQLFRPKDEKLDKFWIDFNVGSGCVSFFIDDCQGFLWGSIHLQMEDVDYYSLKFKQNETVLCVRLTNPIMHLNTRSYVVELTFDPEHQQELEEAAGRVFNKQASPSGAGGAVQTSPSADTHMARSYSRKKPPSKSQLKILPLSSPSSEDESTSLKPMASNQAEVLFDQIVHSTPKFSSRSEQPGAERGWSSGPSERISPVSGSAAFQPPLDPPDGADDSEVHLSNLEEPPSGDLQGAELQTTQHLTEGLEEGSSSPSNKENLRKREAADSGYLSDQAEGVTPSKRKAEPLQDWAESELPMKAEGAELAVEEDLQSEGAKQKAEPESHLTSDITAAFKSFKAQLEQRFTGCWQEVQAEVLRSLRDCQQHVSSLLTAVHQHRLSLLQRFESSVTDHLKQLEENSISLNSMDSEILTFFQSEMEQLSSFCQEHLKKLKNLDSDQLRTKHSTNR